ncbi:MAG: DUF1320 family protein [Phycisphaerales bacterium]|nr:DUF1320 family protein [Phycisphaerales bacterium]
MSYVTTSQLQQRLGAPLYARLTDRAHGESADAAVAAELIASACAEVDAHLAHRFATPLDLALHPELAPLLVARVLDLAEYAAWASSPFVNGIPARVTALRARAVEWLSQVVRGTMDLPAGAPPPARTAVDDRPVVRASPPTLSREELEGW